MAKVTPDAHKRTVHLAEAAESLRVRLLRFRDIVTEVRSRGGERRDGLPPSQRLVSEAELALAKARLADQREVLDAAVDNFSAMWQELRAELDMAHVLAASPE